MTDDAAVEEDARCEDGQCSLWRNVRVVDATVEEDGRCDYGQCSLWRNVRTGDAISEWDKGMIIASPEGDVRSEGG